jgi:hypothetical protein
MLLLVKGPRLPMFLNLNDVVRFQVKELGSPWHHNPCSVAHLRVEVQRFQLSQEMRFVEILWVEVLRLRLYRELHTVAPSSEEGPHSLETSDWLVLGLEEGCLPKQHFY